MRSSRLSADNTWGHRLAAVKEFDVNPLGSYARGCERRFHVRHEARRSAEGDIRLSWELDKLKDGWRKVTGSVEILTHLAARAWPAVTNIATALGEREHEAADFSSEWMMLPIASRVQPQHLPCRANRRQRMQH